MSLFILFTQSVVFLHTRTLKSEVDWTELSQSCSQFLPVYLIAFERHGRLLLQHLPLDESCQEQYAIHEWENQPRVVRCAFLAYC
jgi:hypothetical protein